MDQERSGILLIADISGYTEYLAHTELAHAKAIITGLLEEIIAAAGDQYEVVEIEGDAVFFLADARRFTLRSLRESVARIFQRFHEHLSSVSSTDTCHCMGCVCACKLGVKFVAHYGSFIIHTIHGLRRVIGPDVVLVHRLLKNTIPLREYAAFTAAMLRRLGGDVIPAKDVHVEEYKHIGSIELSVWDLAPLRPHSADLAEGRRPWAGAIASAAIMMIGMAGPALACGSGSCPTEGSGLFMALILGLVLVVAMRITR